MPPGNRSKLRAGIGGRFPSAQDLTAKLLAYIGVSTNRNESSSGR